MVVNPPEGTPRAVPYVYYRDAATALDWLSRVFGFRERGRMPGPGGSVAHAELETEGGGLIMIGQPDGYAGPDPERREGAIVVYVDDVDAHFRRTKATDAAIRSAPEDQFYGDRSYGVADLEGHDWYFATHVRDVSDAEMLDAAQGLAEQADSSA